MKVYVIALSVFTCVAVAALLAFVIITTTLGGSIPFSALLVVSVVAVCCWRGARSVLVAKAPQEVKSGRISTASGRKVTIRCVVFTEEKESIVEVARSA